MKCWDRFCITLLYFLLFSFKATETCCYQQLLRNIGYWKGISLHSSKVCLTMKENKGMIHMKSALFLHYIICTSLEHLAVAEHTCLGLSICSQCAGVCRSWRRLSTGHSDTSALWLASNSAARKLLFEQNIAHRENERLCCGLALEMSFEYSWLGNIEKLPLLWPYDHCQHCTALPIQIPASLGSGNH